MWHKLLKFYNNLPNFTDMEAIRILPTNPNMIPANIKKKINAGNYTTEDFTNPLMFEVMQHFQSYTYNGEWTQENLNILSKLNESKLKKNHYLNKLPDVGNVKRMPKITYQHKFSDIKECGCISFDDITDLNSHFKELIDVVEKIRYEETVENNNSQ